MKKESLFSYLWPRPLAPALATPTYSDGNPAGANHKPMLFASGSGGSDKEKRTVRVGRRRRTESEAEDRERAEAPRRRKEEPKKTARPARPSGGGVRPPTLSGGGLPIGRNPLLLIIIVIIMLCLGVPISGILGPGDGGEGDTELPALPAESEQESFVQEIPTNTPRPIVTRPSTSTEGQTWLVMLYQDADDKILEQDIYLDFNEAERVGSTDRVHIVAQVDRFRGGFQGDGDWTSTRRFYVSQDGDLQRAGSQVVQDMGEVNMSDGDSLVDFVTWAVANYPADRHVLIMSDHGMGWPGGWSDPAPGGSVDRSIPLASRLGDELYLMELDDALEEIRRLTDIGQFEMIGMDACLMGHLEVFSALAPHARYAVASQETEPAVGWAYTGFLRELTRNPNIEGAELARLVVDSYIVQDQRIVDDQARAEYLSKGSPLGGLFSLLGGGGTSADQLARQMSQNITLTAVDLAALPALIDSVNDLAFTLQSVPQKGVAEARTYAQSFTSIFGSDVPPSYIDLGHFAELLRRETANTNVSRSVDTLLAALQDAVIAEKHGPKKSGATGISLYFPNSQLYGSPVTGAESYTAIARRFADVSLWDDFLAFHYTGRRFERLAGTLVVPDRQTPIVAPGAEALAISPITLSDLTAAPGEPVILTADISGENIGYVYLFVGFIDEAANSIFVADADYLESPDSLELDGVYYPDWGEGGEFTMEFEWEPVVFAIDDGANTEVALFTPQSYGATFEDAVYTVEGIYTFADSGESRYARLYFNDGYLRQVFGFTSEEGLGAPREITPQPGDTFTILEKWQDLDARGNVTAEVRQEGGTLTFGEQMFTWEELNAAPGEYQVGFIVEDLDGNRVQAFETITVE